MKKKLFFLRGIPGSGKTTLALLLEQAFNGKAVAADDYFNKDGEHCYDKNKIGEAHKWCLETTREHLKNENVVIVHNTSTRNLDIFYYQEIAKEFDAEFYSLVVENRHGNENIHGVGENDINYMATTLLNNLCITPKPINYQVEFTKDKIDLEVIAYLKGYENLDDGLTALNKNYEINSSKLNGKVLLKYRETSNKNLKIVRECRGLILNEKDLSIVSLPFEKFGNYLEPYAFNGIDIKNAKIVEKLDGSNYTLYYDFINEKWCVQTLGQIEGEEKRAGWCFTWAELFWSTVKSYIKEDLESFLEKLNKSYSYIFELCSQYNKVVIDYETPKLFFIGVRNKETLLEVDPENFILYDIFDVPKLYEFSSIDEIIKVCNELTENDEGFVAIQKENSLFKRVKFKSKKYVEHHYLSTGKNIRSYTQIVFQYEDEEYVSVFPDKKIILDKIKNEIEKCGKELEEDLKKMLERKEVKTSREFFALFNKFRKNDYTSRFMFYLWQSNGEKSGKDFLMEYKNHHERNYKVNLFLKNSKIEEVLKDLIL